MQKFNIGNRPLLTATFLFIIALLCYFLNLYTPQILDDCSYSFGVDGRISSLSDIVQKQAQDYMNWSGRVIPHSIVQFFCAITGKWLFNILNPLMYMLFIILIYKHANTSKRNIPSILVKCWALFLVWFLLPDQFTTTHLIAGSLNYLWASVLILAYILLFTKRIVAYENPTTIQVTGLFALSFLCGGFVEFYSIPVFPALCVWLWVNKIKPNKATLYSMAGFFVGLLFVVLAPGNFVRLNTMGEKPELIQKISAFMFNFIFNNKVFWLLAALAILFFVALIRKRIHRVFFKENALYLTAIVISLGFSFVTGAMWPRVFFVVFVFSFILFIKLLLSFNWNKIFAYSLSVLVLGLFVFSYQQELSNISFNKSIYDDLVSQLQGFEGDSAVLRKKNDFIKSKNTFGNDVLVMQKEIWTNTSFAKYYNKKYITVLPHELYDFLYKAPSLIQERYKVLDNCYTTPGSAYYIVPLGENTAEIKQVTLSYSSQDDPTLIMRPTFVLLFGNSFITKLLNRTNDTNILKKKLYKEKPLTLELYYDAREPYAVVEWPGARYLIITNQDLYQDDLLTEVDIAFI